MNRRELPLVYSCSGCSSAAQMTNHLALQLDQRGLAEMSCISGVGGDLPPLVRLARSGRPVIALDGCALRCVRASLARHAVVPVLQVTLTERGVQKQLHVDFDHDEAERVLGDLVSQIGRLNGRAP